MRVSLAGRVLGIALAVAASASPDRAHAQAQNDPSVVWRTIRTRHFEIHYHEPLGMMARRLAVVAERAHGVLTEVLDHYPRERTHIVLSDDTDSANGSATATPINTIRLYATAPEDMSPLGDYEDWVGELVVHEHTHVIHLDTVSGLPKLVNVLFGKVYAPNNVQPRWFIEGLATYHETVETSGGRLRSTMFDMFLRMDALEDDLLSIDQISNTVDRWPHGNVWYLYGAYFVRYIAEHYGRGALRTISHEYGRQLIPYGINRVARRATGRTFIELYDEFREHTRATYLRQRGEVLARGRIEGRRITFHGEDARSPRFLRDGRVLYFAYDGRERAKLLTIDGRTGERPEHVVDVVGISTCSPHPNEQEVVYYALDGYRDLYVYNDLFHYDRRSGETTRLTNGMRAQDPDISPDGRKVAFTVNGASTMHLVIGEIDDVQGRHRLLVRSRRYEQLYSPRWSPDGSSIAFSAWRHGGFRDIRIVDVASGRVVDVNHDRALDTGPAWSPDGRTLYFSSDRTGIANIYSYDLSTHAIRQITNVLGGAFQPSVSYDGRRLVYVGYTGRGFDLYSLELDPRRTLDAPPVQDERPAPHEGQAGAPLRHLTIASEAYDPLPTLLPHAYLLDLTPGPLGQELGITIAGGDVVGLHAYALRTAVVLERGDTTLDMSWSSQLAPTRWNVHLFRSLAPRGGLFVSGEERTWIEESWGLENTLSYTFLHAFHSETVSLGHSLVYVDKAEPFGGRLDPNEPPPSIPETGWLSTVRASWGYSDAVRHSFDISASEGRFLGLSVALADPLFGSQFHVVTLSWNATQYFRMPWLAYHVLAVRYAGGISGGDFGRRGVFAVGGFPPVSLLDALLNSYYLGGAALRGYPPFYRVGVQYHLVQLEYRFPIAHIDRGVSTFPLYVNRIYGTAFADYGDAFNEKLDLGTFRLGVGGEILIDLMLVYYVGVTLRVGLARGLGEGGETQGYLHLGFPF